MGSRRRNSRPRFIPWRRLTRRSARADLFELLAYRTHWPITRGLLPFRRSRLKMRTMVLPSYPLFSFPCVCDCVFHVIFVLTVSGWVLVGGIVKSHAPTMGIHCVRLVEINVSTGQQG